MNKVKKFRKKPVVIEAYQTDKVMVIHTLEGDMTAQIGDWIITGLRVNSILVSLISLKKL